MNSTLFGDENHGFQVVTNLAPITQLVLPPGTIEWLVEGKAQLG